MPLAAWAGRALVDGVRGPSLVAHGGTRTEAAMPADGSCFDGEIDVTTDGEVDGAVVESCGRR